MGKNVARKLIEEHLVAGDASPGSEIGLRVDQTLTQDATGTLVMLELEAMQLDRVRTELSAQYVDHNLLQEDHKNPDDHLFLRSACERFGIWYSPAGNGVSHPVHQGRFGRPGASLLGSDSHTCAAGAMGMLAIGAGGLEVAMAMAGEPFHLRCPEVFGVHLTGSLPEWVSAKDVILEMLRRHGVSGGAGRILEYHGEGLESLTAMDRHVIANMGAELGATTTVFPADLEVRRFLRCHGRGNEWVEIAADPDATYDTEDEIELSSLEPMIALPSSPGNVVPVAEVAGREIYQAYVGSSANPGFRDFAIAAAIVGEHGVHDRVSFDVNPTSRRILQELCDSGDLGVLVAAGARIHQAGCNGCIGMGQAPATDRISLRTTPRNFPGRSGTREDQVYLCSPETAAASAVAGRIADPRELDMAWPEIVERERPAGECDLLIAPPPATDARRVELQRGPNIQELPDLEPPSGKLRVPVVLRLGDDVSTDEILPAGARVLPFRSNVERIAEFLFEGVDEGYVQRAREASTEGGHVIVAGANYGQGSSREHAALAPRTLGLRAVIAESFSRIHRRNLVNFGVLPLCLVDPRGSEALREGRLVDLPPVEDLPEDGRAIALAVGEDAVEVRHDLSARELEVLRAGGRIRWARERLDRGSS